MPAEGILSSNVPGAHIQELSVGVGVGGGKVSGASEGSGQVGERVIWGHTTTGCVGAANTGAGDWAGAEVGYEPRQQTTLTWLHRKTNAKTKRFINLSLT
ncbi:MAG: hypothetical protein MUO64_09065 [Anaerolineales bacterium]|nr:hypothetical protein [Anaerolineales bacterium]